MRKKTTPLYGMDSQGHIYFNTRDKILKMRHKPESFWTHPIFLVVILASCALVDFACFKQLYDSFLMDEPLVRYLAIGAMIIAFEGVPVYLGLNLKKRMQGYNVSITILGSMFACFTLAFLANLGLRIAFKDLVMPDLTQMSTSVFGSIGTVTSISSRALPWAIFASTLPLITAAAAFSIAHTMYDPLKTEMKRLEKEHNEITNRIGQLQAMVEEYNADPDLYTRLLGDDKEKYDAMNKMIRDKAELYNHYVRERIKEHLGDPASNNELSKPLKQLI